MNLPIHGWINVSLRMDKLPFLNGKMPVYGWINSSLWVDKLLLQDGETTL